MMLPVGDFFLFFEAGPLKTHPYDERFTLKPPTGFQTILHFQNAPRKILLFRFMHQMKVVRSSNRWEWVSIGEIPRICFLLDMQAMVCRMHQTKPAPCHLFQYSGVLLRYTTERRSLKRGACPAREFLTERNCDRTDVSVAIISLYGCPRAISVGETRLFDKENECKPDFISRIRRCVNTEPASSRVENVPRIEAESIVRCWTSR